MFEIQGNILVINFLKDTLHKARQTIKRYHVIDENSDEHLTTNQEEVINHE